MDSIRRQKSSFGSTSFLFHNFSLSYSQGKYIALLYTQISPNLIYLQQFHHRLTFGRIKYHHHLDNHPLQSSLITHHSLTSGINLSLFRNPFFKNLTRIISLAFALFAKHFGIIKILSLSPFCFRDL